MLIKRVNNIFDSNYVIIRMKNRKVLYLIAAIITFAIIIALSPLKKGIAKSFKKQSKILSDMQLPFTPKIGDKLDSFNGVYVYYNGMVPNVVGRNLAPDGYNLGLKYQCVEFVKRYYYYHYKHKMPDSYGDAKDFYNAKITDGGINKRRNLLQFSNPSKSKPKVGDLIIFDGTTGNPFGHVAIISKVTDSQVEIIQQNPGPYAPSRENLDLTFNNQRYQISDGLGWLRKQP